jgi:hypothetical protein
MTIVIAPPPTVSSYRGPVLTDGDSVDLGDRPHSRPIGIGQALQEEVEVYV